MIRSIVLYLATYAATVVMNYGIAQTSAPLFLSYVANICGQRPAFHPLDSLTISGLSAAFVAAYLLRRIPFGQSPTSIVAGGVWYWCKTGTLMGIGAVFIYAALQTILGDCAALISDFSIPDVMSFVVVYSVFYAAVAHLFFDLRRYQFEPVPWRPR